MYVIQISPPEHFSISNLEMLQNTRFYMDFSNAVQAFNLVWSCLCLTLDVEMYKPYTWCGPVKALYLL